MSHLNTMLIGLSLEDREAYLKRMNDMSRQFRRLKFTSKDSTPKQSEAWLGERVRYSYNRGNNRIQGVAKVVSYNHMVSPYSGARSGFRVRYVLKIITSNVLKKDEEIEIWEWQIERGNYSRSVLFEELDKLNKE